MMISTKPATTKYTYTHTATAAKLLSLFYIFFPKKYIKKRFSLKRLLPSLFFHTSTLLLVFSTIIFFAIWHLFKSFTHLLLFFACNWTLFCLVKYSNLQDWTHIRNPVYGCGHSFAKVQLSVIIVRVFLSKICRESC